MDNKGKPILFKGVMVNSIMDDLKAQTRRVMKVQPPEGYEYDGVDSGGHLWVPKGSGKVFWQRAPYEIGTRLYVKETWQSCEDCGEINYRANTSNNMGCCACNETLGKWKPSIFMFRNCSRIDLEVTEVRAQRLMDISEADARAEGCDYDDGKPPEGFEEEDRPTGLKEFQHLWDSINSRPKPIMVKKQIVSYVSYPWQDIRETRTHRGKPWRVVGNPALWAYTLKRIRP